MMQLYWSDVLSPRKVCAVAVTLPARSARIPLEEFPAVRRWHERLNELEAWREPFPALIAAA